MKNGKWGEVILKKIFLIIISTILISLIGLGVIGYYVEKDEAAQAQKNKTEGTIVKEEDKEEIVPSEKTIEKINEAKVNIKNDLLEVDEEEDIE